MEEKECCRTKGCRPETEARYSSALELYRTTDMTVREICSQTGTPFPAFRSYLGRCHRELMFARHGMVMSAGDAVNARLRRHSGQTAAAHAKYRRAVMACDDIAYIGFNVSQIARHFGLSPSALGNQLRKHYPEILERRERERRRLGVGDNIRRGVNMCCREQYAEAVEHLRNTDDTVMQTAALYNLSYSGLREHLLAYNKELVRKRAEKRRQAKSSKTLGGLTGNGGRHTPVPHIVEKYSEAIRLYRTTAMTQNEICSAAGVTLTGFRHHLRIWNRELLAERHDVDCRREPDSPSVTKRYLKSTAAKYAEAIGRLKESGISTADVAKEFGLNPESFREYLHEHEPELASALGMRRLSNGRLVLSRSADKYDEAIRLYETTAEPLKYIATRLGLQYKSLNSFVRRNRPDAIAAHNRMLEQEKTK